MQILKHYALPLGEFDYQRSGHFIEGHEPEGSIEITEEEAKIINDAVTARFASVAGELPKPGPQFHVDLQPLLDRLDAQAKVIADQAAVLDEHAATLTATAAKFDEHAKAITDVKRVTAQAIARSLEGLGETGQ